MTRTKALAKLYKAVSGAETNKKTIAGILKDMYYALIGSETTKISVADILSQMADNYDGSSSGGGGGGDSSDFSTAEVTVVNNSGDTYYDGFIPVIHEEYGVMDVASIIEEGTSIFTVPLYKSKLAVHFAGATVSGNITVDDIDPTFLLITGDGTITLS